MLSKSILIADEHQLFADGLSLIVRECKEPVTSVVAIVNDGKTLLQKLKSVMPDVLILDLALPELDGFSVLESVRKQNYDLKILIVTTLEESRNLREALKYKIDGYILKKASQNEFLRALKDVLQGKLYLDPRVELVGIGGKSLRQQETANNNDKFEELFIRQYQLTKREMEVLKLIGKAAKNEEIGKHLFISEQTVGVHRKNIMRKLGVKSSTSLVKIAYDHNLI